MANAAGTGLDSLESIDNGLVFVFSLLEVCTQSPVIVFAREGSASISYLLSTCSSSNFPISISNACSLSIFPIFSYFFHSSACIYFFAALFFFTDSEGFTPLSNLEINVGSGIPLPALNELSDLADRGAVLRPISFFSFYIFNGTRLPWLSAVCSP